MGALFLTNINVVIYKPLSLIFHDNLKPDEKLLLTLNYEMFPDKKKLIIKKGDYFVVSTDYFSKLKKAKAYAI